MKRYTIIFLSFVALFCSCSDWLDVSPSDEVDGSKLFNSGSGYRIALNGIYKTMSTPELWGTELTWGVVEVLSQQYDASSMSRNTKYRDAAEYNYQSEYLEPTIQSIWSTAYNVIANCNELLKNAETANPALFEQGDFEKNMIHGEALAIRALMHFEILRLYAPSVAEDDGKLYIPYFDKFPSVVEPYQTVSTILGRIEEDLLDAKALLKEVDLSDDAILLMTLNYRRNGGSGVSGSNNFIDPFINFRLFRMNYAATTAILARVYSYAGKAKEAYDQATEVIEMTDGDGNRLFDFTDFSEFGTKPKMSDDLIFSLSNTKATEYWTTFYENEYKLGLYYDDYDEILMENANDRRWMPEGGAMFADYDNEYMAFSKKFMDEASIDPIEKRILPVIRLSELYYIRGEYLAQTSPEAAVLELETVSTARGCTPGNFSWVASEEDYRNAVLQDARKELIGEGQLYYFYKKYNIKPDSDTDFVFPKPLNETIF